MLNGIRNLDSIKPEAVISSIQMNMLIFTMLIKPLILVYVPFLKPYIHLLLVYKCTRSKQNKLIPSHSCSSSESKRYPISNKSKTLIIPSSTKCLLPFTKCDFPFPLLPAALRNVEEYHLLMSSLFHILVLLMQF